MGCRLNLGDNTQLECEKRNTVRHGTKPDEKTNAVEYRFDNKNLVQIVIKQRISKQRY